MLGFERLGMFEVGFCLFAQKEGQQKESSLFGNCQLLLLSLGRNYGLLMPFGVVLFHTNLHCDASWSACWLENHLWGAVFAFLILVWFALAMASSRSRSRSRERILSTAVMVELHKLPQPERQSVQKLKTSISEISLLASLGGFARILKDVAQQAMGLQLPDGRCSAFVVKAELQPVLERLIEVDDVLNTTLQIHLDTMEATFKSLVKSPDGSPYAMLSRAVEFSSRHLRCSSPFFCFQTNHLIFPLQAIRWGWRWSFSQFTFRDELFDPPSISVKIFSSCLRSVHIACDRYPGRRASPNGRNFSLFQKTPRVLWLLFSMASPVASGSGNNLGHLCTASWRTLSASSWEVSGFVDKSFWCGSRHACLALSGFLFFCFLGLRYNSPYGCRCTFEYSWDRCGGPLVMLDLLWVMSRSWCFLITLRSPFFGLSLLWFFTYFRSLSFGSSSNLPMPALDPPNWPAILEKAEIWRSANPLARVDMLTRTRRIFDEGARCAYIKNQWSRRSAPRELYLAPSVGSTHGAIAKPVSWQTRIAPPHRFVRRVTRTASTVLSASGKANRGSPRRSSTWTQIVVPPWKFLGWLCKMDLFIASARFWRSPRLRLKLMKMARLWQNTWCPWSLAMQQKPTCTGIRLFRGLFAHRLYLDLS